MNTSCTPFTATLHIDRTAALLAGADVYGKKTVPVTPSTLTPRQRQTLAALDFTLSGSDIGGAITGLEPLDELLDRAADALEANQRQIDTENAECAARMVEKILAAPLADDIQIDIFTGLVTLDKRGGALVKVDGPYARTVSKKWGVYGLWEGPAYGQGIRAEGIQQTVLKNPDVAEKIRQAEQDAAQLADLLQQAANIRETVKAEREAEKQRLEQEATGRRKAQLAAFVAEHMSDTQQRRFEAGLMAENEILDEIEAKAFAPLAPYPEFTGIKDQAVIEFIADALDLDPDYLVSGNVSFGKRLLHVLDDTQFNRFETFKALLPAARFELLQHFGYLDKYSNSDDPELVADVCKITVQAGEFTVCREYVL
jgi:hypothetical protein